MRVSVKAISEKTGFSPATVSNALNHKRGVNPNTAEVILRAAAELGYYSDNHYTKLKFIIFRRNGEIVDDTPFFPSMIAGVEEECRRQGYDMIIVNLDLRQEDYFEQLKKLQGDMTAVNIFLGTEMMGEDDVIIQGFRAPVVVIDYWDEKMIFNGVQINNEDAAAMAVKHLIQMGHRQIGYLGGEMRIFPFEMRKRGFVKAMEQAGIEVTPDNYLYVGTTMDSAYADMRAYLETEKSLPSAYFADNDIIALGAMRALQDHGYKIPEDVSIIGFDDLSFSAIAYPPLTTMKVPSDEIGREAVLLLKQMIDSDSSVKRRLLICPEFVSRKSVKAM